MRFFIWSISAVAVISFYILSFLLYFDVSILFSFLLLFFLIILIFLDICLCQQHIPFDDSTAIDVTIYIILHRRSLSLSIPLPHIDSSQLATLRVYFDTLCDMIVVFIPGDLSHLIS